MGKKKMQRQASDLGENIADAVASYAGTARDKTGPVLADARDKAAPVLAAAAAKAGPALADALTEARAKAVPVLIDARDRAVPVLVDARDKAAPVLADVRDAFTGEVVPVVTAAISALDDATEDARAEAVKRTREFATAIRGEVAPPPEKHTGRNLLIALGLGGAAFAVAKLLGNRQPTTSWQSSYTPPPAPTPSSTGGPVTDVGAHRADTATDTAASDPGEAVADATDVPHDASTPDSPVTEIDVDPSHKA